MQYQYIVLVLNSRTVVLCSILARYYTIGCAFILLVNILLILTVLYYSIRQLISPILGVTICFRVRSCIACSLHHEIQYFEVIQIDLLLSC